VCFNGLDVLILVLSGLCADVFDNGTLIDMKGTITSDDWKGFDVENDSLLLRQSARLVTDSILSNGAKGLDMAVAVRSWRSLRHLTEIVVAVIIRCR
jgi:hypothetical protein